MIQLRSREEIDAIRRAGEIVAITLNELREALKPGVQTLALDKKAESIIRKNGGMPAFKGYKGYPANICTSINEEVVHGIPSKRELKSGDIVSIDVGVGLDGYFGDAAITVGVGEIPKEASKLIAATERALEIGIEATRIGNRVSDISNRIQQYVESQGFSVVRAFVGHGIGSMIHEEPEVPNFGKPGIGARLEEGMVLAIEPMVNIGTFEVEVMSDGWTAVTKDRKLSAHFEHTIAITGTQAEVLTRCHEKKSPLS